MELQLIHYQSRYSSCEHAYLYGNFDALAILSVMFNIEDEDNPKLDRLINGIENVTMKSDSNFLNNTFPLKDLLPDNIGGGFYRYEGSVTSPSCKEIAIWTILKVIPRSL
jgi:carbonic anhydrase